MGNTLYVKGPLSFKHKGGLARVGEAVEGLAEAEAKELLDQGVLTTEQPAVKPVPQSVTNPQALHPSAAYATDPAAKDPFADSPANNHAEIEAEDEGLKQAAGSSNVNEVREQQEAAAAAAQAPAQPVAPAQAPAAPAAPSQPSPADVDGV